MAAFLQHYYSVPIHQIEKNVRKEERNWVPNFVWSDRQWRIMAIPFLEKLIFNRLLAEAVRNSSRIYLVDKHCT